MPGTQRNKKTNNGKARRGSKWSAPITARSDALDLEPGVFRKGGAKAVAASLKRSAERSRRRKASPLRSAMSMLTFFVNRAGRTLGVGRRQVLERAKVELRRMFGAPAAARTTPHGRARHA